MDLILWRHADAAPGDPDADRPLTDKGRRQAKKMAQWLNRNLPANCRIVSSPAVRTVQTAQALERKFRQHADLGTDTTPEKLLDAIGWPDGREPVLVVGHQPTLGQVCALLLSGMTQDWVVRKGSIVWISQRDEEEMNGLYLKAALSPAML